jgi:predicted enzyme related to lactoylglutathione lyase
MLIGIHALIYSPQPERLRAFFRDALRFPNVDAGHGWLIFRLPPAELAVHPAEVEADVASAGGTELYLMCDDLDATVAELNGRGVELARPITAAGFGRLTALKLPDGGVLGLYEPRHPTALSSQS